MDCNFAKTIEDKKQKMTTYGGICPRNPALSTEIHFVQIVGEILTIGTPSSFRSLSVMCRSAAISTCKILKDCSWSVVQAINPYHTTYLWAASFHSHIKHYPHIRITLHNINSSIDKSWSPMAYRKQVPSHHIDFNIWGDSISSNIEKCCQEFAATKNLFVISFYQENKLEVIMVDEEDFGDNW